jgi:hypothetical protein
MKTTVILCDPKIRYNQGFSAMNQELIRQGRTQEWVKICFAGK